MVGNDVVDLLDRDSDPAALSPRFDERVFDASELELLARSASPGVTRWTLWAAKEAAYKLLVKDAPGTVFSPSRFRVRLAEDAGSAVVAAGPHRVPVRIRVDDGAVHAVASSAKRIVVGVERLGDGAPERLDPAGPGRAVRRLALRRLAETLGVDPADLEIRKRGRVPELCRRGRPAAADLSLSHHGAVVAFACELFEGRRVSAPRSGQYAGSAS